VISCPSATLTPETTVRHMIGSEPDAMFPKEPAEIGRSVLRAKHLSGAGFVNDVSFDLHVGEILGLFGLVGAGRSEVAQMLFGVVRPERGEIRIGGDLVQLRSPKEAIRQGISLLPEDRHLQGLVLPFPIRANVTLPILRRLCDRFGLVNRSREAGAARNFVAQMRVVARGIEQPTSTLSGGNQQKVMLAKWLVPSPRVLILDQPTRGIDVGAKAEIHRIISHLAAQGMAIILISDDAPEVIAMADRIIVLRAGRLVAEFSRDKFDQQAITLAAAHSTRDGSPRAAAAGP
jgi:rhamnose transport system ATP-binding protein